MPGVIVDTYVSKGDRIEKGKTAIKLSAMKMETEIKAPMKGTVKRVLVKAKDNVSGDDLLFEIE
eukprot:10928859-Ditylum_brightwellii.AAC.1